MASTGSTVEVKPKRRWFSRRKTSKENLSDIKKKDKNKRSESIEGVDSENEEASETKIEKVKQGKQKGKSKKKDVPANEDSDIDSGVSSKTSSKSNKKAKKKDTKKKEKHKNETDDEGGNNDSEVTNKKQKSEVKDKHKKESKKNKNKKDTEEHSDVEERESVHPKSKSSEKNHVEMSGSDVDIIDGDYERENELAGRSDDDRSRPSTSQSKEKIGSSNPLEAGYSDSYASTGSFEKTISSVGSSSDDITIVTAYFDIGSVRFDGRKKRTPSMYKEWMTVFSRVANPVVAYFDSEHAAHKFRQIRENFPPEMTRIVQVDRQKMWAFALRDEIAKVFRSPMYPRIAPNTVNAEFACVTHAKYELMDDAIHSNYFETKYYAWMDCNIFKDDLKPTGPPFTLALPIYFDPHKVAYTQISKKNDIFTHVDIIKNNHNWLSGSFFLARRDVMKLWTQEYRRYIHKFMDMSIMNTDQHCIYAMFAPRLYERPRVGIETYNPPPKAKIKPHLYLVDLCKKAGDEQEGRQGKDGVDCVVM